MKRIEIRNNAKIIKTTIKLCDSSNTIYNILEQLIIKKKKKERKKKKKKTP